MIVMAHLTIPPVLPLGTVYFDSDQTMHDLIKGKGLVYDEFRRSETAHLIPGDTVVLGNFGAAPYYRVFDVFQHFHHTYYLLAYDEDYIAVNEFLDLICFIDNSRLVGWEDQVMDML